MFVRDQLWLLHRPLIDCFLIHLILGEEHLVSLKLFIDACLVFPTDLNFALEDEVEVIALVTLGQDGLASTVALVLHIAADRDQVQTFLCFFLVQEVIDLVDHRLQMVDHFLLSALLFELLKDIYDALQLTLVKLAFRGHFWSFRGIALDHLNRRVRNLGLVYSCL